MRQLLAVIAFMSLFSAATIAAPKTVLDKNEQKRVLIAIDNLCGDTWCEGDYGYEFKSFTCSAAVDGTTCELDFLMSRTDYIHVAEQHGVIPSYKKIFPVSCELGPFLSRSDILTETRAADINLADGFLEKVNKCISLLEARLNEEK